MRTVEKHDSKARLQVLDAQSRLYTRVGEYEKAQDSALASVHLAAKRNWSYSLSLGHFNQAEAQYYQGLTQDALGSYQRCVEHAKLAQGAPLAACLAGSADSLSDLGNTGEATRTYNRVLSRADTPLAAKGSALLGLGLLKAKTGFPEEAQRYYSEAAAIFGFLRDGRRLGFVQANLAYVHELLSDFEQAIDYSERALDNYRKSFFPHGIAGQNFKIGTYLAATGRFEEALTRLNEALLLTEEAEALRTRAVTLTARGNVQSALGDSVEARKNLRASLELHRRTGNRLFEVQTLHSLARLDLKGRAYESAALHLERAAAIAVRIEDRWGQSETAYLRGSLYRLQGDFDSARRSLERSIDFYEQIQGRVLSRIMLSTSFQELHRRYDQLIDLLMTQAQRNNDPTAAKAAWKMSEWARAALLLQRLGEKRIRLREGVDPELIAREEALFERLMLKSDGLFRHLVAGTGDGVLDEAALREIRVVERQLDEVRSQILRAKSGYSKLQKTGLPEFSRLQSDLLGEGTIAWAFWVGSDTTYLWEISNEHFSWHELGESSRVEALVVRLLDGLSRRKALSNSNEELETSLSELSCLLPRNLVGVNGKRIVVIPSGPLHSVPFALLKAPGSKDHGEGMLLELADSIIQAPSLYFLWQVRTRAGAPDSPKARIAIFADPVYEREDDRLAGRRRGSGLSDPGPVSDPTGSVVNLTRLSSSSGEALRIRSLVGEDKSELFLGFLATPGQVRTSSTLDHRILHLAAHSFVKPGHRGIAAVALSMYAEDGSPQNGFLKLPEIYRLKLKSNLVVLSSCDTAFGSETPGEGLSAISQGFLSAGAQAVIGSLWKAEDDATSLLMQFFYEEVFKNGIAPVKALRLAQLRLRKLKAYQAPFYWAGFLYQGDWVGFPRLAIGPGDRGL